MPEQDIIAADQQAQNAGEVYTEETGRAAMETLRKMKNNTVPLDKYNKLVEENRRLLDDFGNGQVSPQNEETKVLKTDEEMKELKARIMNPDANNFEVVKALVEFRDAALERHMPDPFLAPVHEGVVDDNDAWRAEQTAEVYKECIKYAKDDPQLFTQELQRHMKGR